MKSRRNDVPCSPRIPPHPRRDLSSQSLDLGADPAGACCPCPPRPRTQWAWRGCRRGRGRGRARRGSTRACAPLRASPPVPPVRSERLALPDQPEGGGLQPRHRGELGPRGGQLLAAPLPPPGEDVAGRDARDRHGASARANAATATIEAKRTVPPRPRPGPGFLSPPGPRGRVASIVRRGGSWVMAHGAPARGGARARRRARRERSVRRSRRSVFCRCFTGCFGLVLDFCCARAPRYVRARAKNF